MTDSDSQPSSLPIEKTHRPRDMKSSGRLPDVRLSELGIIYPGMQDLKVLNVYRDLRNKLMRLSKRRNFVCLVCALAPEDETSLLTLNLGAVIAFDASRSAMVIDCDTYSNVMDELIVHQDNVGLTEFIEEGMDDVALLINESGIDRLRIIACGEESQTRTESLESTKMREVIGELKERYNDRFIVINAPSMRLSSEVQVLSHVSDMVLFQITSGLVTEQQVTDAIELVGAEKVAGIVLRQSA